VVLDENQQHIEGTRAQIHGLARRAEQALRRVEFEGTNPYQIQMTTPGLLPKTL
jgi:hypothetical protein